MKYISIFAMPVMITIILVYALYKKEKVFDIFMSGAKQGIEVSFRIISPIVGIMTAIGMFSASGAMDFFIEFIKPVTSFLRIPTEVTPLVLMKPISGSASLGIMSQMLGEYGVDTKIGKVASAIMGCTETTFYTVAVYFGAVGIKNIKYVIPVALLADIISIVVVCNIIH